MSELKPSTQQIREVVRLALRFNLSKQKILLGTGIGGEILHRSIKQARQTGLTWDALLALDDTTLIDLLFPDEAVSSNRLVHV